MNFKFLLFTFLTLPIISALGMEDQNGRNQPNPRARQLFALAGPMDPQSVEEELDALLAQNHFTKEQEQAFNRADDTCRISQQLPLTNEELIFNTLRDNFTDIMTKPSSEAVQIRTAVKKYQEEHQNTRNSERLKEIEQNTIATIRHARAIKKSTRNN